MSRKFQLKSVPSGRKRQRGYIHNGWMCVLCPMPDGVRGKSRPRFDSRSRRAYMPRTTTQSELRIRRRWQQAFPGFPAMEGPVEVLVAASRRLPKSTPKRIQAEPDIHKPDIDNIAKLALDALNGVAFLDDAQVVDLRAKKRDRIRRSEDLIFLAVRPCPEKHQLRRRPC